MKGKEWTGLIYLASPYNHVSAEIREQRFLAVVDAAAQMMRDGLLIYAPIIHNHPIAIRHELPAGWDYWKRFDETNVSRCDALYVLMMEGWEESVGVAAEINIARSLSIPIHYIKWKDGSYYYAGNVAPT